MNPGTVPRLEQIIPVVAEAYGVTVQALLGRERHAVVSLARQVCWVIARRMGRMSLEEIGNVFGRDHTTVISGLARIEQLLLTCAPVVDRVLAIVDTIDRARREDRRAA